MNRNDFTDALIGAAASGNLKQVERLTDLGNVYGLDVCVEVFGSTPLHWASTGGHASVVKFLLGRGANPSSSDRWRDTPLHWAATEGHVDVAKLLVAAGADVNALNFRGTTPLHHAASHGNDAMVDFLLSRSADASAVNSDGRTALELAEDNCHDGIADLLYVVEEASSALKMRHIPRPMGCAEGKLNCGQVSEVEIGNTTISTHSRCMRKLNPPFRCGRGLRQGARG